MRREEIISSIKKNVARSGGVCYPKNLWLNIGGNYEVDYVEAHRVVFCDCEYCTFDEFSDKELKFLLDAISIDYSKTSTQDLFAMVCKQCDVETVLDNAEGYISEDKIREFLMACLGQSVE